MPLGEPAWRKTHLVENPLGGEPAWRSIINQLTTPSLSLSLSFSISSSFALPLAPTVFLHQSHTP